MSETLLTKAELILCRDSLLAQRDTQAKRISDLETKLAAVEKERDGWRGVAESRSKDLEMVEKERDEARAEAAEERRRANGLDQTFGERLHGRMIPVLEQIAEARKERDEAIDKAIDYMAACTKAETERDAATGALAEAMVVLSRLMDEGDVEPASAFRASPAADLAARHDAEVTRRALEAVKRFIMGGSFMHDAAPAKQFAREVCAGIDSHFATPTPEKPR